MNKVKINTTELSTVYVIKIRLMSARTSALRYNCSMEFAPKPDSIEMRTPVHTFPGDRHVSKEQYWACVNQGYVSSVPTVAGAARAFGIDVDEETFERWKRTASAASLLDDFLDTSLDMEQAHGLYMQGIDYFRGTTEAPKPPEEVDKRLEPSIILLGNATKVLPEQQQERLYEAAGVVALLALWKAGHSCPDNETDYSNPRSLVELLKTEATYTSPLITETTTEYVRGQPGFEQFSTWCDNAVELGTIVNHTLDLREDYHYEITQVEPTLANRAIVAKHIGGPALAMMHNSKNLYASVQSVRSNWGYRLHSTHISKKKRRLF